jgi:molybdopterin-guanine dinucleotide biosynthesis protein A
VARHDLTGILLLGGASRRFGAPKALARLQGETLAERAWRTLGEACEHRVAVGKASDGLPLPFPIIDDGSPVRASIVGLAAGLRAAPTELCVAIPVDCPRLSVALLHRLADACAEAAVPQSGPLPGAYRRCLLEPLESGELSIRRALSGRLVSVVSCPEELLVNLNTLAQLREFELLEAAGSS